MCGFQDGGKVSKEELLQHEIEKTSSRASAATGIN